MRELTESRVLTMSFWPNHRMSAYLCGKTVPISAHARLCRRVFSAVLCGVVMASCAGPEFSNLAGVEVPEPTIAAPNEFQNVYTDIERADVLKTKAEQDEIIQEMTAARETHVETTTNKIVNR